MARTWFIVALTLTASVTCGGRTIGHAQTDDSGSGVRCGDARCQPLEACAFCPGGSSSCLPAGAGSPCLGALRIDCDEQSDCDDSNQCTLHFVDTESYARCTTLDLPCNPPGCLRVCASDADCYPGSECVPAILKYGELDVCMAEP
jgi:hypothetical protein